MPGKKLLLLGFFFIFADMPGVYRINKEGTAILNKDVISLCEYLPKMNDKQLLYIIYSEDYTYGPYHRKPKAERQQLARVKVWGKNPPSLSKIKHLQEACDEYESLIFDVLRYKKDTYTSKLISLGKSLELENEPSRIGSILKAIDLIEERINLIDKEIDRQDERVELSGDRELSLIEKFMRNRKQYRDLIQT